MKRAFDAACRQYEVKKPNGAENLWTNDISWPASGVNYDPETQTYEIPAGATYIDLVIRTLSAPIPAGTTITTTIFFDSGYYTADRTALYAGGLDSTNSWQAYSAAPRSKDLTGFLWSVTQTPSAPVTHFRIALLNFNAVVTETIKFRVMFVIGDTPAAFFKPHGIPSHMWIDGVKSGFPSVKLLGKTEQPHYTGKNLFDINKNKYSGSASYEILDEANRVTCPRNGNWLSANIDLPESLAGNTVTIVGDWEASGENNGGLRIEWLNFGAVVGSSSGIITTTAGVAKTGVIPAKPQDAPETTVLCLLLYANRNGTNVAGEFVTYKNVMVCIGESASPYEPYTGGLPAPTPQQPTEVKANNATIKSTNADRTYDGGEATAPNLYEVDSYQDEWDAQTGKGIRRCAVIGSYAGETITTPYISTTGELSEGAKVIYGIPDTPFETEPMPLTCPTGAGQIVQVAGDISDCPLEIKYLSHGG